MAEDEYRLVGVTDEAINQLIADEAPNIDKEDNYGGLSNNDIIDLHPGQKIWQFQPYQLRINAKTELKLNGSAYGIFMNGIHIGDISDADASRFSAEYQSKKSPRLVVDVFGGRYKQSVEAADGSETVKRFKTPYQVRVGIGEWEAVRQPQLQQEAANGWDQVANSAEKFSQATGKAGDSLNKTGNQFIGCGCSLVVLLIIIFLWSSWFH
ncbi:hypothetical protein [Schleiferilactobacillus shenzhenensis]|nr:hypothetical protein [Schleiferilactobacillus shenzhenensis]